MLEKYLLKPILIKKNKGTKSKFSFYRYALIINIIVKEQENS